MVPFLDVLFKKIFFFAGKVPEVQHEDGRISFNYVGEKCGDKIYYTFNVIMICDSQAEYSYPELFPYVSKPFCTI